MRRSVRLGCEVLESRALLSGVVVAGPEPAAAQVASAAATASDVDVTLTTDQASYTVGQPVHFRLTETNNTDHTVTVTRSRSLDIFTVYEDGRPVWNSVGGYGIALPAIAVFYTLAPGESLSVDGVWDGSSNLEPLTSPTGTFEVRIRAFIDDEIRDVTTTFTVAPTATPAPVSVNLTTDQTSYAVGQPVNITLTLTNMSDHDVTIGEGPDFSRVTIREGAFDIWQSDGGPGAIQLPLAYFATLSPGESYTVHAVWDGQPNLLPWNQATLTNPTGTFQVRIPVEINGAGSVQTTTFVILPAPTPLPCPSDPPVTIQPVGPVTPITPPTVPPVTIQPVAPVTPITLPSQPSPKWPGLANIVGAHNFPIKTGRHAFPTKIGGLAGSLLRGHHSSLGGHAVLQHGQPRHGVTARAGHAHARS